jgi:hypothetical protein
MAMAMAMAMAQLPSNSPRIFGDQWPAAVVKLPKDVAYFIQPAP